MRISLFVFVAVLTACGGAKGPPPEETNALPRFETVSADDESFPVSVPETFNATRGYLVVAENPVSGSDRTIRLPVVIISTKAPAEGLPRPPVLRLAGGPGISGMSAAAYPGAYPWTADRDFIILGQRGTQDVQPALLCPEYSDALSAEGSALEAQLAAAAVCRDRYLAEGIDLSAYHSAASAQDIEALRTTLGIEKLSLYGGSYGTRLALTYARDFPDRVASMVLDSPLPHTARYDDEYPENVRDALEAVAADCMVQAPCDQAYPDLMGRFLSAVRAAETDPWEVERDNASAVELDDTDLVGFIGLGSANAAANAPLLMDAIARRDPTPLFPLLDAPSQRSAFAWGMRLSVWCSEALPFSMRSKGPVEGSFANIDGAVVAPEVCEVWDVPKRPDVEVAATISSVPTLIIAGEYDVLTPPRWGHEAAETLENRYVAVVPYGRHIETMNWGGDGCAMSIAAAFFADEAAFLAAPEEVVACLSDRAAPDFILPPNFPDAP